MQKLFVYLLIIAMLVGGWWSFVNLDISEDIDSAIPNAKTYSKIKPLLDKGKKALILSMSLDSNVDTPYSIAKKADSLVAFVNSQVGDYVNGLHYKSDIDPDVFSAFLFNHLYLFLDSLDYKKIEEDIMPHRIAAIMKINKSSLFSPEGFALKHWTIKDPLHLLRFAYDKLKRDVVADDIIANEGLFISSDRKKLFIYGSLSYSPSESSNNRILSEKLALIKSNWNNEFPNNKFDFFGTFLIADANATQIAKDIKITMSIAIVCILALLFYYFRNFLIIVLFLLPGVFGVFFAVVGIYLCQGHISGIAFGAGTVVLGIVVDYSFHFFSQFKQNQNAKDTRKQVILPLIVSGSTTIAAFLSLTFAHSNALHDFGLFTAFSLFGTLVFVLALLPILLRPLERKLQFSQTNKLDSWFDKLNIDAVSGASWFMPIIVLFTIVFFYFASDIKFESDLNKLNYYPEELKKSEYAHQNIDPDKEKRVHFLVEGNSNLAAEENSKLYEKLNALRGQYKIKEINSLGLFILSDKAQQRKIDLWKAFWKDKKHEAWNNVSRNADALGFKSNAFASFKNWLDTEPKNEHLFEFVQKSKSLSQLLLADSTSSNAHSALITSVVLPKQQYEDFRAQFENDKNAILVDGASVMALLTEAVKADFNYLLVFATILVFVAMLLIYGSIELTLISFIPIAISWIWILGISAILGFKFNFINIIIITFIFGLGDDFAIFMTDGLQTKYKYGRKVLGHYKTGIILSSISTIIGTGVLIFAKHPAIKSIAAISVTGILTIVFISFFVQPILFHFFTTRRTNVGKPPVTVWGILLSIVGYSIFISGSLLGVFLGFLIRLIPFKKTSWKKNALHKMLKWITGLMLDILFNTTKRYYNMQHLDFSKPSIIIANHTSFFDILALARLHPNVIMLVNRWVYDSVLFGNAIRYADYIPTFESLDENIEKARALVNQGYSIVVFPEGSRSADGKIKRFHKGAFFLAEQLKLDITPVVLHGYSYTMPKHDYNLKDSYLSTYVLPRIKYDDSAFGIGYKERTKAISKYFKQSYAEVANICGVLDYQYYPLLHSYKFKGPILEWYFRIKWKFEKRNYENYFSLIGNGPKRIYDLGCGYGFLSYYLKLRNDDFDILGFDYDEDKIAVAQNSYLKREGIAFHSADISVVKPQEADAIILADILHYLPVDRQLQVLKNCNEGLKPGGIILIRDGLADMEHEHKWTKKSEQWSTKYLKFNKTQGGGELHFFTKQFIVDWAKAHHYNIKFDHQSSKSSNVLMILTRQKS